MYEGIFVVKTRIPPKPNRHQSCNETSVFLLNAVCLCDVYDAEPESEDVIQLFTTLLRLQCVVIY